jgi:hypothetical protein
VADLLVSQRHLTRLPKSNHLERSLRRFRYRLEHIFEWCHWRGGRSVRADPEHVGAGRVFRHVPGRAELLFAFGRRSDRNARCRGQLEQKLLGVSSCSSMAASSSRLDE